MSDTYLVQMPTAEARHLAGIGPPWPATAEARCVATLKEWLHGVQHGRRRTIPVCKVVADLTAILAAIPASTQPVHGPFAPGHGGLTRPGRVEYLGAGVVRLDQAAISSLTGLPAPDDFRVALTDAGPVLSVGAQHYLAHVEQSA